MYYTRTCLKSAWTLMYTFEYDRMRKTRVVLACVVAVDIWIEVT